MTKLSNARLSQINEVLDESFFTSAGFKLLSCDDDNNLVASLAFIENDDYYINLYYKVPRDNDFVQMLYTGGGAYFEISYSPGDFMQAERLKLKSFEEFLEQLKKWADRVKGEILLVDIFQKKMDEFQDEWNQRLDDHVQDGDSHFTAEERAVLHEKMTKIEQRIRDLEDKNSWTEAELERVYQTLSDLNKATFALSKRSWFRTAGNKLYALSLRIFSSEAGQNLLEGAVTKLLE